MNAPRLLTALLTAWITAACAPALQGNGDGAPRAEQAQVEVTNRNWQDMNIYIVRPGMKYRLGMVHSMGTTTFPIPDAAMTESGMIRLHADPIGSTRTFTSEPIRISDGQEVEFTVENLISTSSYAVWTP